MIKHLDRLWAGVLALGMILAGFLLFLLVSIVVGIISYYSPLWNVVDSVVAFGVIAYFLGWPINYWARKGDKE